MFSNVSRFPPENMEIRKSAQLSIKNQDNQSTYQMFVCVVVVVYKGVVAKSFIFHRSLEFP